MKKCTKCKTYKNLSFFHKDKTHKDGYKSLCQVCCKENAHKRYENNKNVIKEKIKQYRKNNKEKIQEYWWDKKYGLSKSDFDIILAQQKNACAICNTEKNYKNKSFAVDYNHETGKVRGLLCSNCNVGLGQFGESISILKKAIQYLESYS